MPDRLHQGMNGKRILALEPYYGGSHKAFLHGWIRRSRHQWTPLVLPARKWRWRMRHAAVTFSEQVTERMENGETWDLIFCSDMMNLAEFLGMAPPMLRQLPVVLYFHENQLTYPLLQELDRDYHFPFSNITSGLCADHVWFNSAFHQDSFLEAIPPFLNRMPDHRPLHAVEAIREKSSVHPPFITQKPTPRKQRTGPLHILWAARWEFDKAPERFFDALEPLKKQGIPFTLSVLGVESCPQQLPVFTWAYDHFSSEIQNWGYRRSRSDYDAVLQDSDVVVSTADHEFFGIGILEAVRSGVFPLVPNRLSYPEILGKGEVKGKASFFYSDKPGELTRRLKALAAALDHDGIWEGDPERGIRATEAYTAERVIPAMDAAIDGL